jgi:hypothetical protein
MIEWLENNFLTCSFVKYFGVECPGCGLQRALAALLKGDLIGSLKYNPALICFLITLVYLVLHLKKTYQNGARNLVWMFSCTVFAMLANFIYKLSC